MRENAFPWAPPSIQPPAPASHVGIAFVWALVGFITPGWMAFLSFSMSDDPNGIPFSASAWIVLGLAGVLGWAAGRRSPVYAGAYVGGAIVAVCAFFVWLMYAFSQWQY